MLAEVRLAFATDRTQVLDLPPLPKRPGALQWLASSLKFRSRPGFSELRRLAERTARDYEADVAADNSLPAEHRRLRRMFVCHRGPPRSQGRALALGPKNTHGVPVAVFGVHAFF
jgi:hypothetical protein